MSKSTRLLKILSVIVFILAFILILSIIHSTRPEARSNQESLTNNTRDSLEGSVSPQKSITLDNIGNSSAEGHTPTTFRGSGTGLFIGDNLHANFPPDAGLQAFIAFDLTKITSSQAYNDITLSSSFGQIEGAPLTSLGALLVDVVSYTTFSPDLWDTPHGKAACALERSANGVFSCDIASAVNDVIAQGATRVAFRLRFEQATNGDGLKDLLSFRHYDPNANFPGLFQLSFRADHADNPKVTSATLPLTIHRIIDSGAFTTSRSTANIQDRIDHAEKLWAPTGITFDTTIIDTALTEKQISDLQSGDISTLTAYAEKNPTSLHGFFLKSYESVNGIAFDGTSFAVVDTTTVRDYRTVAHEIGHLLGLPHTKDTISRLMYQGSDGHTLSTEEITTAKQAAKRF